MERLVKYSLESGGFVFIEVEVPETEEGIVKAGRSLPEEATQSFESAINNLSPVADTIISKLINIRNPPDEAAVEFGLTLKADVGAVVITKIGTEANFKVNLKWTRKMQKS